MPDGTYTVAWKNVSTVDGHRVRGSFVFAVGQPLSGAPVEVRSSSHCCSRPSAPLLRWLTLLGALTIVGGLTLELLVTRPALLSGRAGHPGPCGKPGVAHCRLTVAASSSGCLVAVFLVASVGQLLLLTTIIHEVPLWDAFGGPLKDTVAVDTEWGELWALADGGWR